MAAKPWADSTSATTAQGIAPELLAVAHIKLAPSILTADFARLADEVRAAEQGGADYMHLDVMDGHFVPPITIGPVVVGAINRATSLTLDVHLMIEHPERQIEEFANAGADIINVHVETCGNGLPDVLSQIRALGRRAGVSINPLTPISAIESVLDQVDQVMVMGVNPGWGGQAFIPETMTKLRELRELLSRRGISPDVEVDGGVKLNNCAECIRAGANVLVVGSAVYNDNAAVGENLRDLRRAVAGETAS